MPSFQLPIPGLLRQQGLAEHQAQTVAWMKLVELPARCLALMLAQGQRQLVVQPRRRPAPRGGFRVRSGGRWAFAR